MNKRSHTFILSKFTLIQPVYLMVKAYLDKGFDIAFVSELSHRERSAFKPVYSMTKWWARRSSSVFRALLLGVSLPMDADLAQNFYQNHQQQNPNFHNKIVLDPFMGGATTIVEGLRLGFKAIGVDLNPLSWFIAKTETTPVNDQELQAAYERLQRNIAPYIKTFYQTNCACDQKRADILHTFWVKVAPCTHEGCTCQVPLFRDYIVGMRRGDAAIHHLETDCPVCNARIDLEIDKATLVHKHYLGFGKEDNRYWVFWSGSGQVECPSCQHEFTPNCNSKVKEKKVSLYALICPSCEEVFPHRGNVLDEISCPSCQHIFNPKKGNTTKGTFICKFGHQGRISDAVALEPNGLPLDFRMVAIEGYCIDCKNNGRLKDNGVQLNLLNSSKDKSSGSCRGTGQKFYKRPDKEDLALYCLAEAEWNKRAVELPYPYEAIGNYEKTNRLIIHNYNYWIQLFNARQSLALASLLQEIMKEPNEAIKEALVAAFLGTLEHQNMLNIYYVPYAQSAGAFGRHDYHPKVMVCEGNVWGSEKGRGTFRMAFKSVRDGKKYLKNPYDPIHDNGKRRQIYTGEAFVGNLADSYSEIVTHDFNLILKTQDSRKLDFIPDHSIDYVVTDPPYADAVQYSELADFFYVWLRVALSKDYPELFRDYETPKKEEIVENKARGHTQADFHQGLCKVFKECHRVLKPNGRLVFTFHHGKESHWSDLLNVLFNAGFLLIAAYPVASEGTKSGNLVFHSNKKNIAYDIIHVCQKANYAEIQQAETPIVWDVVSETVLKTVKKHIKTIQNGRDHGQRIHQGDISTMVWGECLNQYAKHYGHIIDLEGELLSIEHILKKAYIIVEQLFQSL